MGFWDRYNLYTKGNNFLDNFLLSNNIVEYGGVIGEITLDTNHTFDGRESRASATATLEYAEDVYRLFRDTVDYGFNMNAIVEESQQVFSNFFEYTEVKEKREFYQFDNTFNDCTVELESQKHNYNEKSIDFIFDFRGDMHDANITDWHSFQVAIETLNIVDNAPYWGKLLSQATILMNNKQYDLAFLLTFSAVENFTSLLCEQYEEDFYNEINITSMELLKKIKLVIKHINGVKPSKGREEHPSMSIILDLFDKLYKNRNNVAHGNYRDITIDNCKTCLNFFILYHTIVTRKPNNNNELLRFIKGYNNESISS